MTPSANRKQDPQEQDPLLNWLLIQQEATNPTLSRHAQYLNSCAKLSRHVALPLVVKSLLFYKGGNCVFKQSKPVPIKTLALLHCIFWGSVPVIISKGVAIAYLMFLGVGFPKAWWCGEIACSSASSYGRTDHSLLLQINRSLGSLGQPVCLVWLKRLVKTLDKYHTAVLSIMIHYIWLWALQPKWLTAPTAPWEHPGHHLRALRIRSLPTQTDCTSESQSTSHKSSSKLAYVPVHVDEILTDGVLKDICKGIIPNSYWGCVWFAWRVCSPFPLYIPVARTRPAK